MRLYRTVAAAMGDEGGMVELVRRLDGDEAADRLDIKMQMEARRRA